MNKLEQYSLGFLLLGVNIVAIFFLIRGRHDLVNFVIKIGWASILFILFIHFYRKLVMSKVMFFTRRRR